MKTTKRKAFTLVELLVVISIIGILAGLAIPMVGKAKKQAFKLQDTSNLKQVGLALKLYAGDYDGQYPIGWLNASNITDVAQVNQITDANQAFRPLFALGICKDERIFNTPGVSYFKKGDNKLGEAPAFSEALKGSENSYSYFAGLSENSDSTDPLVMNTLGSGATVQQPSGTTPWTFGGMSPQINEGNGLNVLYADGSVTYIPKNSQGKVSVGTTNSGGYLVGPAKQ